MKLTVVHGTNVWLAQTKTWLYNQVCHLPDSVENHVFCNRTENLNQFPIRNIHSFSESSALYRAPVKVFPRLRPHVRAHLLARICRNVGASVLHSHFGNEGYANISAAKRARLKHVVTFYGFDIDYLPNSNKRWYDRYRELFRSAACILCEGTHMAGRIEALGCPENKIRVHHLGVRVDEIPFKPRQREHGEPLQVLIASSFREKKGIPYALEALGRLQHEIPLGVTIVGDAGNEARSQAEKREILATIKKHGLESKVRMLGFQPHATLYEEMYGHHIFLSPSITASDGDTEGGAPVSIIEMAASGMPVVSTRHCDIPEVVRDGVTGWLAEEKDVEGLVAHLRWLAENPERWRGVLEAGRRHVAGNYNADRQAYELSNIYNSVCSR